MKKVMIATIDSYTKEIIRNCVTQAFPKLEVIDVTTDSDILYHVKSAEDDIIFFDKYFLSYVLKFKILSLRMINENLRIYFCETGECSRFFGMRLFLLGVDGFVSNIENRQSFTQKIRIIPGVNRLYPDEVLASINDNEHLLGKKCCSEVTELEYKIGLKLGQGKSIKEISDELTSTVSAVGIHVHRLKKKIGYKSMNDFSLLNQQMERFLVRSWAC